MLLYDGASVTFSLAVLGPSLLALVWTCFAQEIEEGLQVNQSNTGFYLALLAAADSTSTRGFQNPNFTVWHIWEEE